MSEDDITTQYDDQELPEEEAYDDYAADGADDYASDDAGYDDNSADDGSYDDGGADDGSYDDGGADDGSYDDGGNYSDDVDEQAPHSEMKKEWKDSIVVGKRVKREEMRRKLKRAMIIMLVFSLIVTSVVYVMLLFIEENNVRITANSDKDNKSISLSMDNSYWTPFLNPRGPRNLWNVSYNPDYTTETPDTREEVEELINASDVKVGTMHGENFIRFVFMLRNNGREEVNLNYEMTLEYEKEHNLQNAVRVMWGESFKHEDNTPDDQKLGDVRVFAARSSNRRLQGTNINLDNTADTGFTEYVAYPTEVEDQTFDLARDFETQFTDSQFAADAAEKGYFSTIPFDSDEYVFRMTNTLPVGDVMYCYVCIWLEGSDFDCVDSALGGYVKLGINFVAS